MSINTLIYLLNTNQISTLCTLSYSIFTTDRSERLSDLPKVTQLVSGVAGDSKQAACFELGYYQLLTGQTCFIYIVKLASQQPYLL